MPRFTFAAAFAAVIALWTVSLVSPSTLGRCQDVPLRIGKVATARDCEPYPATDYAVPVALLVMLFLISGMDRNFNWEFTLPGGLSIKREANNASAFLEQESAPTLDERGEDFVRGLGAE